MKKDKNCEVCAPKIKKTGEIEAYDFEELKKLSQEETEKLSLEELKGLAQKERIGNKK